MYAVVRTGGKQYKVTPDQRVRVEKLPGEVGDQIELDEVLLTGGESIKIGQPRVEGAKVVGTITDQGRGPKLIVFKLKRRKNYRRRRGYRASVFQVKIAELPGS